MNNNKCKQVILLIMVVLASNILLTKPITILEETNDYIRFRFTLPEWKFEKSEKNNIAWDKIICDEGISLAKEGYPTLVFFAEALGIPIDGDVSITMLSSDSYNVENVKIEPTDKMVLHNEEVSYKFFQDLNAYKNNELYPRDLIQKGTSAFIGNRNMIPIHIFPFRYNAANHRLSVLKVAEIVISVHGNKTPLRPNDYALSYIDQVGNDFFLNNRTSQFWRKPKDIDLSFVPMRNYTDLVNELQLIVDREGIYKITYQYLATKMQEASNLYGVQFGWSLANVDPRNLELRDKNGPVPIHFSGEEDGVFNPTDFFEFYGDRNYGETHYQDDYTAENVYTLYLKDGLGARMAVENGGLVVSNPSHYIVPDAYEQTVHFEQQLIPDKLGRSWFLDTNFYREDLWFWLKITAPNLEIIPIELQYPKDTTIRTFSTKISIMGLTYLEFLPENEYDHKATIRLNQSLINTKIWRDQREMIFENELPIPNSFLQHGTNYYYISMNGDTPMGDREQILLDYIELKYWREYKTSEDFIRFGKPSNRPFGLYQFSVEGFSRNDVSVYKLGSSVFNNLQIEPFTLSGSQPWTVTFQDSVISNDAKYYAVTENLKRIPKDFRANKPSYLKSHDNTADCIIITHRDFVYDEGTMLYKNTWENYGYQVMIVDLQDIFDEFNSGIRSANSIKEFLKYAYNNWSSPQLKSVVLLGDGTDDERDNSQSRRFNIIPVRKVWTSQHGATAADNWYGCIVGDDMIPDISIARINVWNKDQILQVAQKSQKYFNQPNFNNHWHNHVILASGGKQTDANDIFSRQCETIRRTRVPKHYRTSRVYTNTQSVSSDFYGVTSSLMSRINEGAMFLQFMGHGGGRIWADYNLFNLNNVASLNNSNFPIVSSLACYCSAFDTNGAASISEALVLQPNKGAIATIGFTGLGYLNDDLPFGQALTEALFMHDFNSLGEAFNFTKAKFYISTINLQSQQALTHGSALLGDPNIRVIKPQKKISVTTDKDHYAIGDTLRVNAVFETNAIAARTFLLRPTEVVVNPPNETPIISNIYNYSYVFTGNPNDRYQRKVFVSGYSDSGQFYGYKDIAIGKGLVTHLHTIPEQPTWQDSIYFKAHVSGIQNINNLTCMIRLDSTSTSQTWVTIPMVRSASDTTHYLSGYGLSPQTTGKEIFYKYRVITTANVVSESFLTSTIIAGPEFVMEDIQFTAENDSIYVKTLIKNIGNSASINTSLKLYRRQTGVSPILLSDKVFAPLEPHEQRWATIKLDSLFYTNVLLEARINVPRVFPEWSFSDNNNIMSINVPMNYHNMTTSGGVYSSTDTNLMCEVPANLVPLSQTSMFYAIALDPVTAYQQPDIVPIKLKSGINSIPYEVGTLNNGIVDSSGAFLNGRKLKLTFFYNSADATTQQFENENSYKIYRWESEYQKWILQGGNISVTEDKVVFEVSKQGIYSLLRNKDNKRPSIDVNVQDQEFTVGGYISGNGTVSFLLSDANGIDVIDDTINLFLDGQEIPIDQWIMTINPRNINFIPIKYQLNLPKGTYTLVVDCKDLNGNFNSRDVQFIVNDKFDVIRIANYPNPVLGKTQDPKNAGRTRFTYVLTDDADEVSIKLYTVSGRLVKTFMNLPTGVGYHEFPRTVYAWDCTDEQGFYLANGVYFYKVTAKKGNKKIEKIQKMAILK